MSDSVSLLKLIKLVKLESIRMSIRIERVNQSVLSINISAGTNCDGTQLSM